MSPARNVQPGGCFLRVGRFAVGAAIVFASLPVSSCDRQTPSAPPGKHKPSEVVLVALQPLGHVSDSVVDAVKRAIGETYVVDVVVLKELDLPKACYYEHRKRYRAQGLLAFLDECVDKRFAKIIGVTTADISITKGAYFDWGIFGLGALGGRPCVISTFRLDHGGVSRDTFVRRLMKVANHET